MQKFEKAEIDALLAEYRDHQAKPSPMVHLSQRQLDAMLEQAAMRLLGCRGS